MVLALILAIFAVFFGVFIHLFNISIVAGKMSARIQHNWGKTQVVVLVAVISQVLISGVFTACYLVGMSLDIGAFKEPTGLVDVFYFSLTTITTLGLGSVEPTGHLRMLAGIESATGFLLISCSAQKVFKTMK